MKLEFGKVLPYITIHKTMNSNYELSTLEYFLIDLIVRVLRRTEITPTWNGLADILPSCYSYNIRHRSPPDSPCTPYASSGSLTLKF